MEKVFGIFYSIFFIAAFISFLIVFVLVGAIIISQPDDAFKEFKKYKIGRYSFPVMIVSFLMIFILNFVVNKIAREKISTELSASKPQLYINGFHITNDSLIKDIQQISKTSSSRNTGATEINIVVKNGSKVNHLKLLRSFEDSTKYWVSSNENGIGCFGEVNTKYLSNYK